MFWKHQPSPNDGQNITNKKEFKFYIKSCSTLDESITMIQNKLEYTIKKLTTQKLLDCD